MKKILVTISIVVFLLLLSVVNAIAEQQQQEESTGQTAQALAKPCYGFIISVHPSDSRHMIIEICRAVNELLREDIDVYWLKSDLTAKSREILTTPLSTNTFLKGSFIIPINDLPNINYQTLKILSNYSIYEKVNVFEILVSLNNIEVYEIIEPDIAYHAASGGNEIAWTWFFSVLNDAGFRNAKLLTWKVIPEQLNNVDNDFNLFIWGGKLEEDATEYQEYKPPAVSAIKEFIANGGGYVGACYGGYVASYKLDLPWDWLEQYLENLPSIYLKLSSQFAMPALPGIGEIIINIEDSESPLAYGLPSTIKSLIGGGPIFLGNDVNTNTVASFCDVTEYFYWKPNVPYLIRNLWYNYAKNKPIWTTIDYYDGKAVAFGDHPEYYIQERVVFNSVFYTTSNGPYQVNLSKKITLNENKIETNGHIEQYKSEPIQFSGNAIDWTPTNWNWIFGDNEISFEQNPIHSYDDSYNYSIITFATDESYNLISYDITTADINNQLRISVNPDSSRFYIQDMPIDFSSYISGGFEPYTLHWDFGDGTTSDIENPTHEYIELGNYFCSLTVEDNNGKIEVNNFGVAVNDEDSGIIGSISASEFVAYPDQVLEYIAFASPVPDGNIFRITFGDGTVFESDIVYDDEIHVYHSYSDTGKYIYSVEITNIEYNDVILRDVSQIYITDVNFNENNPPNEPKKPDGFITGKTNSIYYFRTNAIDIDGDEVWFTVDSGDGNIVEHEISGIDSGYTYWFTCSWEQSGIYNLRVKAEDEHGAKSNWSNQLQVTITESEPLNR